MNTVRIFSAYSSNSDVALVLALRKLQGDNKPSLNNPIAHLGSLLPVGAVVNQMTKIA